MKQYKCICGKIFDSPNKFNAHKSHCREHLGEEKYLQRNYVQMKAMSKLGNEKKKKQSLENKSSKDKQWLLENHYCEHCGKLMTEKYGSGRFCCRQCANSRIRPAELRNRVRESLIKTVENKSNKDENVLHSKCISGYYNNIYCSSSWELIYLLYCEHHNITVERCNMVFKYRYKDRDWMYVPDFYLPESNTIVELKGQNPIYYNSAIIELKNNAVINSDYNFKIIYEDEYYDIYYRWAKDFYKFTYKKLREFCSKLYT